MVSVVVPTRNSIRTVEACLRSIRGQTYPAIELIVVDNESTDSTWEVATRMADVAIRGGPERSAQRNLGIARSSGTYVLWIDSDMKLEHDVTERAVEAAESNHAVGVFIPEISFGDGFWTKCRILERRCYLDELWMQAPRLVRRDYLERTGGFAPWVTGTEDSELRMRLLKDGDRLARTEAVILHDEGRLTLTGIARKRYYYGRTLPEYRRTHPGAMSRQAHAAAGAFLRSWRLLVQHPMITAGIVAMRATELVAYFAGGWAAPPTRGSRSPPVPGDPAAGKGQRIQS